MNPIDIVPVDHQLFDDRYADTAMVDSVIENPGVHSMTDLMPSRGASLNSINKPLIQRQNGTRFGRTTVVSPIKRVYAYVCMYVKLSFE